MRLFHAPADKANHYLYGTLSGLFGSSFAVSAGHPEVSFFLAPVTATIIGLLYEVYQYLDNRAKQKLGLPVQHTVEPSDIFATMAGGLVIGLAVFFHRTFS